MRKQKKNINLKRVVLPTLSGIPHPRCLKETDYKNMHYTVAGSPITSQR